MSIWRPSTWRWLFSLALLCAAVPATAAASWWPAVGGSAARAGGQEVEPGELPAAMAWGFAGEDVRTPPIVTGGGGPSAQRVAYGTADGRVRLRELATGAEVGAPGGLSVADATVTDPERALASGFVSSSTDVAPGVLFVVHDDGGGVEVARLDEVSGARLGADVSVPGSLGCEEAGAPLLTPVALDGTRLLFFTIRGACPAGNGLVRFGVSASGELLEADLAPVSGLGTAPPALTVIDGAFHVAVGRAGGVDFRRADGALADAADATVAFEPSEVPAALAWTGPELLVLAESSGASRVHRIALGPKPRRVGAMPLPGLPAGLAVSASGRIAVATGTELSVLAPDLTVLGSSPGAASAPAIAGDHAYVAGRSVRLGDARGTELAGAPPVAPAIARGFVVFGSVALENRDTTAPSVVLVPDDLAATVADDRGVAGVVFRLAGRRLPATTDGSAWAPARYAPPAVAPGRYAFTVRARDLAGNAGAVRGSVTVACERSVRGSGRRDVMRGTTVRDCLDGRGGRDTMLARGGGADRVICGRGRDLARVDAMDRVADDCERVRRRSR